MTRNVFWVLTVVVTLGLLGSISPARHAEDDAPKAASAKPATVKATKGTIKVEISLKGILEAAERSELSLKPEAWTAPMMVKKAVEHGTIVKKGDVLVEIDQEKIDQAIRDLRLERDLAELSIRQAQEELPILAKSLPLDLAQAELAKKQADEDLKKFLEVDRALSEEDAEQMLKGSVFRLQSAREELKQLQKMYRDKDLTEETEEIILKRQRAYMVEVAEHFLKSSRIQREQTLKVQLPRREQRLRDSADKMMLALEKAKNTSRLTLSQKRLALDKLRYEHDKSSDRLKNLERDREMMTVRAPDGVVYHGKCVHGRWETAAANAKLQAGGMLMPSDVFMTVVSARPIFVRATVEEKDLHLLRQGLAGKAVPSGYPECKLAARLQKVSTVPQSAGSFDARVAIEPSKDGASLMPGMACTVKLTVYRKDNALTVPAAAIFRDENEDEVHYVYVAGRRDNKAQKRIVKVGKTAGKRTEILDGLREGDEILPHNPEKDASSTATGTPTE